MAPHRGNNHNFPLRVLLLDILPLQRYGNCRHNAKPGGNKLPPRIAVAGHQRLSLGVRSYGIRHHKPLPARQLATAHRGTPLYDQYLRMRSAHHRSHLHRHSGEIKRHTTLHLFPVLTLFR